MLDLLTKIKYLLNQSMLNNITIIVMYRSHTTPEKFGENIDGIHGVFILLVKHKMAEAATVLRP